MTDYRRSQFCGGYYFFTVVTYKHRCFLVDDLSRTCLRVAWRRVREDRPFEVVALCLLPEHLHCVWRLPKGDNDFSQRWMLIKKGFTRRYLKAGGCERNRMGNKLPIYPTINCRFQISTGNESAIRHQFMCFFLDAPLGHDMIIIELIKGV